MKHAGTKTIETGRLVLRPFRIEDAQPMYENWASDPEVTKFLMWPTHPSVEVSREVLKSWICQYPDEKYYQWAIVLKENGEFVDRYVACRRGADVLEALPEEVDLMDVSPKQVVSIGTSLIPGLSFYPDPGSSFFHGQHAPYGINRYGTGSAKVHRQDGHGGFPNDLYHRDGRNLESY